MAAKVTANLGGSSVTPSPSATGLYRVRKSLADAKSQNGAFKSLNNAKKCADSNNGYAVFDANGKQIYPTATAKKSVDAIAREVIQGKWDNGTERRQKLIVAGYDYSAVQKRINELLR